MTRPTSKDRPGRLENCPFCGGKPRRASAAYSGKLLRVEPVSPARPGLGVHGVYESLRWYAVKCTECGVAQPKRKYMTHQESDDAWNTRA